MATYSDDFNRANGAVSANSNWETPAFSDGDLQIESNVVTYGVGDDFARWVGGGTWGRQQRSSITIATVDTDRNGPAVYVTDSGCYCLDLRPSTGSYIITKVGSDGSYNTLGGASTSFGAALSVGDVVSIEADDDGSGNTTLTTYLNGVVDDSKTDTTSPITSGDPGFHVDQYGRDRVDAWEGEDYTAAASATVTATVTDASGTALASETGIDWHWSDTFNGNPTDTGTGESTDGSGIITVDLSGTSLSSGQSGYLTIKLSNGDVGIARETLD